MAKSYFRRGALLNPEGTKICRFKKGDRLQVMTGKHLKAVGTLVKIETKKAKVVIEGVNSVTRSYKRSGGEKGQRKTINAPLHVSNVALVCPKCTQPTRVAYGFLDLPDEPNKKKKVRICKRCKAQIDD
jgi:large subunit ribosomal protein L24